MRLAKSLHSQKVSITWAEKMEQKLDSVLVPKKMSWATATQSIRKCKTRIEKIGGSRVDTGPTAWGLNVQVWDLLWTDEEPLHSQLSGLHLITGCCSCCLICRTPPKWQQNDLVSKGHGCAAKLGACMNWVDWLRTSADKRMWSGRRAVVMVR